jgi:hypothetical protein
VKRFDAVAVILGFLMIVGCGARGATVSGKVTLDGSPLDDATISFVPTGSGQRQAAWTMVTAGQYKITSAEGLGTGPFRVEIRALRPIAGAKAEGDLPTPAKEAIPSRYNSNSELVMEIKPGENTADFALKSR